MKRFLSCLLVLLLSYQPVFALDVIQSVARSFVLEAPALDKTDGVTAETGLTPGTFVVKKYEKNRAPVTVTITTAVFASSIITNTGNMTDGDTVTFTGNLIDGQAANLTTETYRFKNTLAQAYDVKIGASAAVTWDNLKCAINDTGCGGEGTDWGTGTVASVLVNATTNTDTQQTVVANVPGTLGNSFTTAETSSAASWTSSTLASGADGMVHDASGYYWFCQPATFWAVQGDMLLTFNYNAEMAPFFQKVRVVAARSDETNVRGLGASTDELLETNLNTVASTSAWAYKLNQLDIATSAVWNELKSNHLVDGSFGLDFGTLTYQTTIATLASQTSFTLTAGSADNDAYNGWLAVVTDVSTHAQRAVGVVGDYTGATKTVTLLNDPAVFTMAVGDYVTLVPDRSLMTVAKNVAYSNFTFSMVDSTDGQTLETGLTVSGTISKDGGAFAALTNAVSEIGTTGRYKVDLTAAEMNADEVYLAFTATGARRVEFKIRPQR